MHENDAITQNRQTQETVIGLAWYRPAEWSRLLFVSEDRNQLERTWSEWHEVAEQTFRRLKRQGHRVKKVDIDVDELVNFCIQKRVPVNADARSEFAGLKVTDLHSGPEKQSV